MIFHFHSVNCMILSRLFGMKTKITQAMMFNFTRRFGKSGFSHLPRFFTMGIIMVFLFASGSVFGQSPSISQKVSKATCPSFDDGSIDITVANLSGALTYSWSGPNAFSATSEDISGLIPGNYTVSVYVGTTLGVSKVIPVGLTDVLSPQLKLYDTVEVALDSSGNVDLYASLVIDTAFDDCGIKDTIIGYWRNGLYTLNPKFNCDDIGTYFRVQVQVVDLAGRQRTKQLFVTPKDITPPVLRFYKNVFLQLGEDGSTILHNDILDSFSRDVCSGNRLTWTLDERNFDCSDLPYINAKVRVEDEAGNGVDDVYSYVEVGGNKVLVKTTEADSWTTHRVGIDDCRPPVAVCKADTTLYLDSFGNANISALDINNGSTDNCGISYFYMEDSVFNCDKVGVFDYTMTAVDVTGNLGCCLVEITVLDTIKPVIGCKDTTLSLDSNGQRELTLDLVNRGTYDNCSFEQISFNNPILTCGNIGGNSIEMTIVDNAGTLLTCNSNVIIVDDMPPVAICKNFTLEIGAAGTATLQVSDINDGSWDNCAIATTSISKTDFTCADAGTHTITLTVTDVNGNSSTCQSTVDVVDNSAPTISCKNVTIVLDASGDASIVSSQVVNSITDNCSGQITVTLSKKDFTCTDIGTNTITVTATDPSGNSASCQATVTVEDNMDPVITGCPSDIIYTSSPNCQEYVNWTVPTISDNCSYTVVASHQPGSLFLAGTTTVTYTVTDAAGNVSTCSFDVKISNGTVGVQTSTKVYNGGWNVSCYSATDGEITTTVSGGCAGGYTYIWSNGSSSTDLTGIGAGTYTVTVSDASGVTATSTVVLTEPSELTGSTNKTDISCGGSTKTVCDITHYKTGEHAVWLPNIPNVNSADFVFANNSGKLEQFSNGTARITGSIVHENDPNYGWEVDLWFNNGMDWNQWSALGRDYKGNHSAAQNNHQDWTYYTFDNSKSNTLIGTGSYLGSTLYLTHRPTNYRYGLQVGVGANDKDGDYGMSTWFNYSGSYSGKGDINVDGSCINTVNCDGSAEILNLAGGTPPYTIQWSNGESTAAIDNLCAGSYTVTVTDQNGCELNETVVISAPQPLVLTVSSNDATCSSGTNGTAGVTVSGGRTPYTYLWSTGSTANSISGLTPGSYSVAVTDASGCLEIAQVEISRPVCCNVTNGGSIAANQSNCGPFDPATLTSVTPSSGGLGTLEYLWLYSYTNVPNTSGNPYWQAIPNSNSATYDPGSTSQTIYYMRCARRAGCSFWAGESNIITIEIYPTIAASTTVNSDVSCNGGSDGSATASSSVGTTPFTYTWSNGATTATASSLSAGTYTVTVTDANGCSGTATATIGEPTAITVNVSGNDATCATGTDGDATATVSGGTAPYAYLWSNGATTSTIQNLSPGTYSVTITDANGCVSTGSNGSGSVTISRPACCNVTDGGVIAANQSNCGSFDPAVLTSVSGASGGLGTLEYLWLYSYTNVPNTSGNPYWQAIPNSNSATYDPSTTNQTIYYMRCARRQGCTFWAGESNVITITVYPQISIAATGSNLSCNGANDGSVATSISGGTLPLTYAWSNGATTSSLQSISAGSYTVTVTDANGCSDDATVSITQPDVLQLNGNAIDISCNGCMSQTSCDINFSDLDNGEEVNTQYTLSGVTISAVSNNTSSGYNKVIVFDTDLSGTQDPDLEINVGNVLIFPENVNDGNNDGLIDNPDDDVYGGTVTLAFSSARDIVSFDFYDKDGGQSGWAKAYDANNNVIASASIPNMGNASIQTITLNAQGATKLVIYYYDSGAFGNFKFNCANGGSCDGEVDLAPSGGTAPYTYVWSNGETTEDIDGLTPGTYSVVITDANGCTENGSFVIEEPTPLAVSLSATDVDCYGASTGVIDATVSGATPGYTFDWSGSGGFTSNLEDITGLVAGDYELTVTDSRGCSETATVTITEPQGMTVTSTVNDASCTDASDGDIDIAVTGGSVSTTTGSVWEETFEDNSNGATSDNGSTAWTRSSNACYTAEVQTVGNDKVFGAANGDSKWYSEVIDISNSGSVDVSVNLGSSQGGYHESSGSYVDYVKVFHRIDGGSWCLFTNNGANYGEISSSGVNATHANITGSTLEIKVWMHSTSNNEEYYVDDVTVTGSISSTYTYAWSNGATTQDISGLSVGTYTVTITDDAGCAQVETFTVGSPAAIVVGGTASDVSCSSSQTTETTVYDYNGSRSFWMPGLAHGNEPNWTLANGKLTQYPDGTAHLTGSLTNNLYASKQFDCSIWFKNKSDWSSWSGQGKTWKGNSTTVGNNYQDWTYYDFDDTKNNVLTGKSYYAGFTLNLTQRPSNKTMGLQIGDAANDKDSDFGLSTWFYYSGTFQGTGYSGDGDINSDASTSSAGCDGEVDMTFTGGTSPYSYSWSTGATSEDIDGLCSGSYTVTVTDGNGCTGTKTYTVNDPSPIVASASASQSPCGGGTINLSVSGGATPYTYAWTGPNGYTASSEDITVTDAGTYEVTVTDANGCTETATASINQSANLTVSVSTTDVDCYGNANGSATTQVSGGSTPYTYSWSNGGSAATAGQLGAGSYYVTVTDGNGCSIVKAVSISEPSELQLNLTATVHGNGYNVSTNGGSDGSITASVTGGTTPYSYSWNGGGTIKTVSKRIAYDKDDAEEYSNGQMSRYSSDLELVNDGSAGNQKVGVRFRNLGIPQGATIVDAYIQFTTEGTSRNTSTASLTIKGEKSGNCNYFSSSSYDLSNRTMTSASVAWSPSQWHTLYEHGTNQQTPDLKAVVQEIVNLSNWDTNDAMVFVITGSGRREAYSYDGNSNKAPKLYVRYTEAPTGSNPSSLAAGSYSVVVTDANGCSKNANITLDEPPLSTPFAESRNDESVDQRGVVSSIKIGPNPVSNEGVVSVELSETEQVEVVVMDMTGKDLLDVFNGTLEAGTTNTLRADMTALRAGIYQICVRTSSGEVNVQRFVIAR